MDIIPSNSLKGKRLLKPTDDAGDADMIPMSRQENPRKRTKAGKYQGEAELTGLPEDAICNITSFLDARTLLDMRLLNHSFRSLASLPNAGWTNLCNRLWSEKVHVCPSALNCQDRMAAYRMSILDAKERDFLSLDELVFNPETNEGTVWSFRFKESAGEVSRELEKKRTNERIESKTKCFFCYLLLL